MGSTLSRRRFNRIWRLFVQAAERLSHALEGGLAGALLEADNDGSMCSWGRPLSASATCTARVQENGVTFRLRLSLTDPALRSRARSLAQAELAALVQAAPGTANLPIDALTGTAKKTQLQRRLSSVVAASRRSGKHCGVLFIDLDDFKPINDQYGHLAGDEVLAEVGDRLRSAVRANDLVARFGGDEFAVVLTELQSARDIENVKAKLVHALTARVYTGHGLKLRVSVGTACFPNDGDSPKALIRHADAAMYDEKRSHRYARLDVLKVPLLPMCGRQSEIASIEALLENCQLVSVVSVGGMGKSRLAIEIARRTFEQANARIHFIDAAAIVDRAVLVNAIVEKVNGLSDRSQNAEDSVLAHMSEREALIILDGCESLSASSLAFLRAFLSRCKGVRILATTRAPLGLTGEAVYQLGPLALAPADPLDGEYLRSYDAVAFFAACAKHYSGKAILERADLRRIANIVQALCGIPLAIDLAAARTRWLSIADIEAQICGESLSTTMRETLSSTVEWTLSRLSAEQMRVLTACSLFAGSFSLNRLKRACALAGLGLDVEKSMAALVDHALVQVRTTDMGERYTMLEPIRHHCLRRAAQDAQAAASACAQAMMELAETCEQGLRRSGASTVELLKIERDNLNGALEYYRKFKPDSHDQHRLLAALCRFWYYAGEHTVAFHWLGELQPETLPRTRPVVTLLRWWSWFLMWKDDYGQAKSLAMRAIDYAEDIGADDVRAEAYNGAATVWSRSGDTVEAVRLYTRGLSFAQACGNEWLAHGILHNRAATYLCLDQADLAANDLEALAQLAARRPGFRMNGDTLWAWVHAARGNMERAYEAACSAIADAERNQDVLWGLTSVEMAAFAALHLPDERDALLAVDRFFKKVTEPEPRRRAIFLCAALALERVGDAAGAARHIGAFRAARVPIAANVAFQNRAADQVEARIRARIGDELLAGLAAEGADLPTTAVLDLDFSPKCLVDKRAGIAV